MLRILKVGASATALIATVGVAAAADFPSYESPPPAEGPVYTPAPAFSWSGPYVGLTGGYGWGGDTISHDGWIGGAYAGYNFQMDSNVVVGLEGDFTFTGKSGTSGGTTLENPWNGTVRGRIGYALDPFLIYGTGGLAVGKVEATTGGTTETATELGWTAGVGVEAALSQNITARAEYRHTNLGTTSFPVAGSVSTTSNDILVGVGFKF